MKLVGLIVLALCAVARCADEDVLILAPGQRVTKNLENNQYELQFVSPDYEGLSESDEFDSTHTSDRIISGAIKDLLEDFRDVVVNGTDERGPLDPLEVDSHGPFEFRPSFGVTARGTLRNVRMDGLRWFVANRVTVNPLRLILGMDIIVPSLTLTGAYTADARIYLMRREAAGNFRVFAHRIEVGFDMRMGTGIGGGGTLFLRQLDVHIDIHDTQISLTGMTGSSILNNMISAMIQNLTQEAIQNQLETVSQLVSDELFDIINDILQNYTVGDIFG